MRTRRKSIAPWLLFFVAIVLLLAVAAAAVVFAADQRWLPQDWQDYVDRLSRQALDYLPGEKWKNRLIWLGGLGFSAVGVTLTFVASWHFLEMNLPRRIEDLKNYHTRDHLALQPQLLAIAQRGLRFIPADIETSRLTLLRKWLSGWSLKEQARLLAASSKRLGEEATALAAAAKEAQHQAITAHLIRGYQAASQADEEGAFEEFEAATRVRDDDVRSRDIAAGWARRVNDQKRELQLLHEIQKIDGGSRSYIDQARAFRREAELIAKRNNDPARAEALERLRDARNLLEPHVGDSEASLELGRVLTLFCEVRCDRGTPGKLNGPNQPLTRMRQYIASEAMHTRTEEPSGEEYGGERALKVEQRVAELLGEGQAGDGNEGLVT